MLVRIILAVFLFSGSQFLFAYERSEHSQELYLGYGGGSYKDVASDNLLGGVLSIGYDINSIFAIESQFGVTAVDKQNVSDAASLETQMSHASLFARANLRSGSTVFYGYVGRSYMKVESTLKGEINFGPLGNLSINETADSDIYDYGYGLGVDLFGSDQVAMHMRWLRILDVQDKGNDAQVDAVFLGFTQYVDKPRRYIRKRKTTSTLSKTKAGENMPVASAQ